jgi:alpha-L-fucosidase
MFIHFGPNTFTDVEWGNGKEDPKVFNPTDVDCRQWAATAKAAGMQGIIITAKHHDGFCLWPSNYSTHTVRESLWQNGKGDILRELSEACKEYGLKFGVYLSPWDQNHPAYGTPEYNQIFANTLNEVLSGYGEVFEQWFDGANGEGHGGKKQVYDWNMFHEVVYRNQPQAIVFSDVGPGCRWMGNEGGVAGETNWSTLNIKGFAPGKEAPPADVLNKGVQGGEAWVPAETDVSIRPGWFYSPSTDDKVKSVDKLMDIYYTSVGRNSNLLLNVPPDRRGRIHPNDSVRLIEFRKAREEAFGENLITGAAITANATRGNSSEYAPENMQDENYNSYWTTDDNEPAPYIEIDIKKDMTFNRLLLQEYIPLGQRVSSFTLKYQRAKDKNWTELTKATTIGYKRILRFPAVTAQKLRIEFNASACPVISTIGIYKSPEQLSIPVINRDKEGFVSIECRIPGPVIYYTLDGSTPSGTSTRYEGPFPLPEGGIVKAAAIADKTRKSETVNAWYDIAPKEWKVLSPQVAGVEKVIDGHRYSPATIDLDEALIIDLGQSYTLKGFSYTPQARVQAPNIYKYDFYASLDSVNWVRIKSGGTFSNIANNPVEQTVLFDKPEPARYIKVKPVESVGNKDVYTIAEIGVITKIRQNYEK